MSKQAGHVENPERRMGLSVLALLLVPLLLFLQAPVLAAVLPGALITIASIDALQQRERHSLTGADIVAADDREALQRIASATEIESRSRRIDPRA